MRPYLYHFFFCRNTMKWITDLWSHDFSWMTTKPLFAKVAMIIVLVLALLAFLSWIVGMLLFAYDKWFRKP